LSIFFARNTKNAQALNLDVFEKGWGMFLLRLVHRLKTRWHPASF